MTEDARVMDSSLERLRDCAHERDLPLAPLTAAEGELRAGAAELTSDEALLVALKRIAERDPVMRPYARAYAESLLPIAAAAAPNAPAARSLAFDRDFWLMLGCAVAAAVAIKLPDAFGMGLDGESMWFARNVSLLVLPFLALYFALSRGITRTTGIATAAVFAAGAVVANVYPFSSAGATAVLTAVHLPIVLWLTVGVAFASSAWRDTSVRMQYVRFTGEWLVTYVLIALGGAVLTALSIGTFQAVGVDVALFFASWVLPMGAAGAVIVAAWLVVTRRNLVGGMAPMLARVFTPLFAIVLVGLLAGVVWTKGTFSVDRDALILFDLLLVVVLALLLYAWSSRDPQRPADLFDTLQLVLVGAALVVDLFALGNIGMRLGAYGLSANKVAALGLNVILLVNLAGSAYLQYRFVRGGRGFADVERWQMRYLPVYWAWAAIVVVALPPLFRFA